MHPDNTLRIRLKNQSVALQRELWNAYLLNLYIFLINPSSVILGEKVSR